jgi:uncharacterized membrane protein YqhA
MWQVLIHLTFVLSAIGIAHVDRLSEPIQPKGAARASAVWKELDVPGV